MSGLRFCACLLAAILSSNARAQDECDETGAMETNFGEVLSEEKHIPSGSSSDVTRLISDAAKYRYIKAMVRVDPVPGRRWTLFVRDAFHRVLDVVSDSATTSLGVAWSKRIPNDGTARYFDFQASPPDGPSLTVLRMHLMPTNAENPFYSVQDRSRQQFASITSSALPAETRMLGDHVGMLVGSWENRMWCCTAVAIAPDVVLTNWHCGGVKGLVANDEYWTQAICDRTSFDFSWDGDGTSREFECTKVLQASERHDFAVLRVTPRTRGDQMRPIPAWASIPPAATPELTVIQHPLCREKQATVKGACRWRDAKIPGWRAAADADFSHTCDTFNGSSGAPVFDERRRFVGLHHLGFQKIGGVCDKKNKAVHAQTVAEALDAESIRALGRRPDVAR